MNFRLVLILVCGLVAVAMCQDSASSGISQVLEQLTNLQKLMPDFSQQINQVSDLLSKASQSTGQEAQNLVKQAVSQLQDLEKLIPVDQKAVTDQLTNMVSSLTNIMSTMTGMITSGMGFLGNMMPKF